jgi:hypothetical protein
MPRRTKENTLSAKWSKKEKDVMFHYPSKPDGHYLYGALSRPRYDYDGKPTPSIIDELKSRGYDVTTLLFSICKNEPQKQTPTETSGSND